MTVLKSARVSLSVLTQEVTACCRFTFPIVALCVSNSGMDLVLFSLTDGSVLYHALVFDLLSTDN